MKKLKTALFASIATIIAIWLCFAFVLLEANPFIWTQDTRIMFIMLIVMVVSMVGFMIAVYEE